MQVPKPSDVPSSPPLESTMQGKCIFNSSICSLISMRPTGLEDLFAGLTLSPEQANTLIRAIELVTIKTPSDIDRTPEPTETGLNTTPDGLELDYHVPEAGNTGPFYVVTKGLDIGIFGGW